MDILQPLLGEDKSNPLIEILFDLDIPNELLVYCGMHFLKKVRRGSLEQRFSHPSKSPYSPGQVKIRV
jgi:hypothetical protein